MSRVEKIVRKKKMTKSDIINLYGESSSGSNFLIISSRGRKNNLRFSKS